MLTEERALAAAAGKMRRLRRNRRVSRIFYWGGWAIAGVICLLLLAGGIAGLASA